MLEKYSPQILERQRTRFPEYISALENLSKSQEPEVKAVLAIVTHGMRNDLAIVTMVFELDAIYRADRVLCEVI